MQFPSAHLVPPRRMGMYDPVHHISMWGETFKGNGFQFTTGATILDVEAKMDQSEDTSHDTLGPVNNYDEEPSKPNDKVQRRLAQNREAARKSRLRKKAYVQQLESSRLKLIQLEQELNRIRQHSQQGLYLGGSLEATPLGFPGAANSGISTFELEYGQWVEEQNREITIMKAALEANISDGELKILVDSSMNHYCELFRIKAAAAKVDVFYLMSGMWKTTAERFFLWIGGFRPSELLKILVPRIEHLSEQQIMDVCNLKHSCQQAEDALSQGMDKLQQIVTDTIANGELGDGRYNPQMSSAMEKLEALVCFVNQADHLREETLQQMCHNLTIRQSARGLLALGEYFQRLRALSSLWATRSACEST